MTGSLDVTVVGLELGKSTKPDEASIKLVAILLPLTRSGDSMHESQGPVLFIRTLLIICTSLHGCHHPEFSSLSLVIMVS